MKRASVHWINLEPSNPPEFGKTRPCLIVSNTEQNLIIPTIAVIPLSSKAPEIWPLRVRIEVGSKNSFAVIPGIRQVSKTRIMDKIADLSSLEMNKIEEALFVYLSE